MEHAKLANGSRHKLPIGHSPSPALRDQMDAARSAGEKTALKKAAGEKTESARPLRKEMGSKSKSGKLVCRYCGSDGPVPTLSYFPIYWPRNLRRTARMPLQARTRPLRVLQILSRTALKERMPATCRLEPSGRGEPVQRNNS
jgi:hypothetical protein